MRQSTQNNLQDLYKLPWSTFDNPNGWIEPTTYCQLACPGCYRGLDKPSPQRIHEQFSEQKKEIDTLIKIRKIKILSIAGGEPLLYPKLDKLISYAKTKGLAVRLVSNGAALTEKRLFRLKEIGVSEIAIHLASYQNRASFQDESGYNLLRESFCKMFRKVGGVELNFIITVSKANFNQLPQVIDFYKKNSDVVNRVLFTLYRDAFFTETEDKSNYVPINNLVRLIRKKYQTEPCAYLGKSINPVGVSWLFFAPILCGEKVIASADAKTAKKLFEKNIDSGWNSFPAQNDNNGILDTISTISLKTAAKVFSGYITNVIRNPKETLKFPKCQIIILLNTPQLTKHGWDLCDGCPDAILYKGKLVPSCALEKVKMGENITLEKNTIQLPRQHHSN